MEDNPTRNPNDLNIYSQRRSSLKVAKKFDCPETQSQKKECRVDFVDVLETNANMDQKLRERVMHNQKYNDDRIFVGTIFEDVEAVKKEVHSRKDKFNAKNLLSVPFDQIEVSEDEIEEQQTDQINNK